MNVKILFAVLGMFLLLSACALPYEMYDDSGYEESLDEEPMVTYEEASLEERHPPIVIEGGRPENILYAGLPNTIKVYIEGESTEHLEVFCNNGRLIPINKTKGLYEYYKDHAGFAVEVVAKDSVSGNIITKIFDVVSIPAPNAYIWKSRTIFKQQTTFDAATFKLQNAVILQHTKRVPALCLASSYTLIRVDANGKRTVHHNKDNNGLFNKEAQEMIQAAQKGDVYIVKNIRAACTPIPIRDIVYVIK